MSLFDITVDEAIRRMNLAWKGLIIAGPNDVIHHEDANDWANEIYYGRNSKWWLNPPKLKAFSIPLMTATISVQVKEKQDSPASHCPAVQANDPVAVFH